MRFLLLTVLMLFGLPLIAQGKQTMAVVKIDMQTNDADLQVAYPVTEHVVAALLATNRYQMVERSKVDALAQEISFGTSGYVNPATAARFGQMLGAKLLVTGGIRINFGLVSTTALLDLRIIETETGNILNTFSVKGSSSSLSLNASTEKCLAEITRNFQEVLADKMPTRVTLIMPMEGGVFLTDAQATKKGTKYRVFQDVTAIHPNTHERITAQIPVGEAVSMGGEGGPLMLKVKNGKLAPGMSAELLKH